MQVAFSVIEMQEKKSRTTVSNKIMKPLHRKQMCTMRAHDAQVFGNGNNSHNMYQLISRTPCPRAQNPFACANIFHILFDSLLKITLFFLLECVCVLITAHFVGKMTRRINRVCVCVYFAATLIRARLKCAYKILTTGKK